MNDWLLLGGAVTLNGLGQQSFWRLLLVTPATLLMLYLLLPRRAPPRQSRRMLLGLYALLWGVFLVSHLTVLPPRPTGGLGHLTKGLLEYIAFPLYYSKYRDWRSFFLVLTGGTISFLSNSIATFSVGPLDSLPLLNLTTGLILSALTLLFARSQRPAIWAYMERQDRGWPVFCSIPALLCGTMLLFRSYPNMLAAEIQNPFGMVFVFLLQPVVYRVLFSALDAQQRQAQLEQSAAVLQAQVLMMEEQGRQMERRLREEAVARHDQRHFQQIILAHLGAGDIAGARAVLQDRLERGEPAQARYCEDPVLDQILAHYAKWAQDEGTAFEAKAHIPGGKAYRRTELMVVLCNALENAHHACARIPDPSQRKIAVSLSAKGRQVYLEVSNTYAGELQLDPDTGLPQTDRPGHGYGLQRIGALASRPIVCKAENGVFRLWMVV